jgi:type IV pilus assembly protein PilE
MSTGRLDQAQAPQQRGFTLIEVMIVVAIVAILASVALPAYNQYIRRGQLQEALTTLADQRIRLEQYYQDNRRYGPADGETCFGTGSDTLTVTDARYFTYTCETSASGQAYVITATGVDGGNTDGFTYTINESGAKATTSYAGTATTTSCWALKSSSDCS